MESTGTEQDENALSQVTSNAGADACLGLYDKYYDTYFITTPDAAWSGNGTDTAAADMYTVVSGDNLSKIAGKLLGDRTKWIVIYDMNLFIKNRRKWHKKGI